MDHDETPLSEGDIMSTQPIIPTTKIMVQAIIDDRKKVNLQTTRFMEDYLYLLIFLILCYHDYLFVPVKRLVHYLFTRKK
jgi:hypothetical protein